MSEISQQATEEVFGQEGGGFLACLTISHPDLAQPIRVVDNTENVQQTAPLDFTFDRNSAKFALNMAETFEQFAADVPAVTDAGIDLTVAATNRLLCNTDLTVAPWSNGNVTVTPAAALAPDGTMTAFKLQPAQPLGNFIRLNQVVNGAGKVGGNKFIIYAKKGSGTLEANRFHLRNNTTAVGLVNFNFNYDTGAMTALTGLASSEALADGWWKISLWNVAGINDGDALSCYACFTGGNDENQTEFAYVWMPGLYDGIGDYDPIATAAAAVTQSADALTLPLGGTARDLILTFDDLSTQTIPAVSGDYSIDPTTINRQAVRKFEHGSKVWDFITDTFRDMTGGNLFIAFPFTIKLPEDAADSVPKAQLTIDNVSREIAQLIRSITTPPTVTIEIIRISDFDAVEVTLPDFQLRNTEWDALTVTGDLMIDDIAQEQVPQRKFTPSEYPGLF